MISQDTVSSFLEEQHSLHVLEKYLKPIEKGNVLKI